MDTCDGYNVFKWSEFRALMKVLGVPDRIEFTGVEFGLTEGEVVRVNVRIRCGQWTTSGVNKVKMDGFVLYRDPVFVAFCNRLGFRWELLTIKVIFQIAEGEQVRVIHVYRPEPPSQETADTPVVVRSGE